MFVDDVTLELGGRDDVAIPKLKVFDEETCAVERLLAANASDLLVDLVVEFDVAPQARRALELIPADAACLELQSALPNTKDVPATTYQAMLLWAQDLVLRVVLK
jgi:hypothetical protein